jgi:hypothetical protein
MRHPLSPLEFGAVVIVTLAAFLVLGRVLVSSRYGFDFTDEGFYYLWIANPWNYTASASQFGFLYHPLFELMQGDIATIRQINFLLMFGLSWAVSAMVLARLSVVEHGAAGGRWLLLALSGALASASLFVTAFELPQSPSYNTLVYKAVVLGVMAMLLADSPGPRLRRAGFLLLGVSWWLAFMAKPPTAVALALVWLVYFLIAGRLTMAPILVSAATAVVLLLGSAWVIDGSISAFVSRYVAGIELGRTLGDSSTGSILRVDKFPLSTKWLGWLLFGSTLVAGVVLVSFSNKVVARSASAVIAAIFAIAGITISLGGYPLSVGFARYDALSILALPMGCLLAALVAGRMRSISRGDLGLAICLLLVPHIYAFGTYRPQWLNAQAAGLFWILAGLAILTAATRERLAGWKTLLPVGGAVGLLAAVFVHVSVERPMRQPQPLRLNTEPVDVGRRGHELALSSDFADYIRGFHRLADAGRFEPNTPVIDLTGRSPGIVYALRGTAPGAAWLLGGYERSEAFAVAALDGASCDEMARAWIITEPSGPNNLSSTLLERYGITLERHYQDLGVVRTTTAQFPTSYTQHLLKPVREPEEARSLCELKRQERGS